MPRTEVRSNQIKDGTVGRSDLNTATAGEAVVAKIVAGTGVSISFTGADTGTGDVTVSTSSGAVAAHQATHQLGGTDVLLNNAWTDRQNIFTQPQVISRTGTGPKLIFTNSALTAGQQTWALQELNDTKMSLVTTDDAGSDGGVNMYTWSRTGLFTAQTVQALNLNATTTGGNVACKDQANIFTQPNTFQNNEVYQKGSGFVRYQMRETAAAAGTQTFVILTFGSNLYLSPALDDGSNTPNSDGNWNKGLTINRSGDVRAQGALTAATITSSAWLQATDHVGFGGRYGSAYIQYDGATTTVVGGGNITLAVNSYSNVVRFINGSGPYIAWDGGTYSDLYAPQYLRLYPANGNILAWGAISIGASYDGGGPKLVNDFGNGTTTSLRIDVSPLSYYFRSTGTNAFFCGTAGGANCGHPSYPWAAVYANLGTIQPSDADLKENIQPNNLGLEFIEKLQAKRFDYKQKDVKKGHIGFMAQDVEEALEGESFAALDKPKDGPSGLNYAGFVPVLVQAIQELSARIRALET